MNRRSTGLRRWTQRFTIASAGSFVVFLLAVLLEIDRQTAVLIGVFGFVCPMIFGMAYLLFPSYAGRTLIDRRLAGIHFVTAYIGVGFLVLARAVEGASALFRIGVLSWTLGIVVFVGALLVTVGPLLVADPLEALRGGETSQRSSRLATAAIPIAIAYLVVGTVGLITTVAPIRITPVTLSQVIHYYMIGFGALLVYALGARLLLGFFHVSLPRPIVGTVLVAGLLAPALLGTYFWIDPWFQIGAALATVAMLGYVGLVAFVARRTDRIRVGLSGIVLGAIAGSAAIVATLPIAFGGTGTGHIAVHRTLILAGFFPLTIVGYAYLFFPIPEGQFIGASPRSARTTIGLLAAGVGTQTFGTLASFGWLHTVGTTASILGAIGYSYLLSRRFSDI
jgi:hypothetical protein